MSKKSEVKKKNFVIKSNTLVEARYRLSLQESQVVLWLLTQIDPDDEDFKSHKLDVAKFADFTGVRIDNRYAELRRITKQLMQRVIEIYSQDENKTIQVAWLSSAEYEHRKGIVSLEFSPKLKPYLLQLKNHFTKINIVDTLKLKSIHAVRIFELLLQYNSLNSRKITIIDLRSYCGIKDKEYPLYADLKRKVIEKARIEITSKTEYKVTYTEMKESRKVVAIEWRIKKKDLEEEKLKDKIKTLENELNYKLILVKDLMDYGYSKTLSNKIVKENDEMVIKNALLAVSAQLSKNQVKNPGAMLRTAIKERWHPERYTPRKESKNEYEYVKYSADPSAENIVDNNNSNNHIAVEHFKHLSDLLPKFKKF